MAIPAAYAYPYNTDQSRSTWNEMILEHGELAVLRQPGQDDRWIAAILGQFTAQERLGGISNPADRKAVVSVISPDTGEEISPEPSESDTYCALVLDDDGNPILDGGGNIQVRERLKIVAPPTPIGNNRKHLYWRLQVRA